MDPELQPQKLNSRELADLKKKRRLERKKQKKLERKQRLLERKKILLEDCLVREIKYGQTTYRKYQAEWEKLLQDIAIPRLIEEVELAQQNFERIMDVKDYTISCLMDKLRWDEDYYVMCLDAHIFKLDEIIHRFHEQLDEFRNDYNKQIEFLSHKENEFLTTMEKATIRRMHDLKILLFSLAMQEKTDEMNMRAEFCAQEEAELTFQEVKLFQPRIEFDAMLRFIYETKEEIFKKYNMQIKTYRSDYDEKLAANEVFEKLSSRQLRKIERLSTTVKQLRAYRDDFMRLDLEDLQSISDRFKEAYQCFKQRLVSDLKIDKRKNQILVWTSQVAYSNWKSLLNLGQNLICLLQICRKLETADDKTRPYPVFLTRNEMDNKNPLYLFFHRMGKIDASRSALSEEKMALKLENKHLRQQLKELCICSGCPRLPVIYLKQHQAEFTLGAMMKCTDLQRLSSRR